MFGFTGPTQYDLRFSLFGIPIYVNPFFWVMGAIMGWGVVSAPGRGPLFLINWMLCLFVSILIHELGHALFAKKFGWPPQIFLYHMGGLAVYQPYSGHTTGRNITISFAGPAVGFLFYGIILACEWVLVFSPDPLIWKLNLSKNAIQHIGFAIYQLKFINLYWGLINLLPVLPLDGGRISETLCDKYIKYRGKEWAAKIGMAFAGLAAAYFFMNQHSYPGFLFAYLCYINFNNLQRIQQGY
ncbi:hypothetical protein MNBD_PLANCTO02-1, partial [hydrothermal vent metagenome]